MPTAKPAPLAAVEAEAAKFWRYIGGVARTYMHIPVTVEHGDVVAHDGEPAADGHWESHPGPATREPDNAPKPPPAGAGDVTATAQE